jgi:hypothetical protein
MTAKDPFDFSPLSVAQALERLERLGQEHAGESLSLRLEDQVVKLNLLRRLAELGWPCQVEQRHHLVLLRVQVGEKAGGGPAEDGKYLEIGEPLPSGRWLVLTRDQLGLREVDLGQELLSQALGSLDPGDWAGVMLVHRGVRLLDATFPPGDWQARLGLLNLPVLYCPKSLAAYNLAQPAPPLRAFPLERFAREISLPFWVLW